MPKSLVPIQIDPGFRDGTQYEAGASWIKGNLIRWHEGRLKPMRPWRKMFSTAISGQARGAHYWTASNGMRYLAIATQTNIYVVDIVANRLRDVTPATGLDTSNTYNLGPGYGSDAYGGTYDYGSGANIGGLTFIFTDYARWSLDNWGDQLLLMKEGDGKVWKYDPTSPYQTSGQTTDSTADLVAASDQMQVDNHALYTVGDLLTGVGIDSNTYVNAISTTLANGTYAITLSKPALSDQTNTTVTISNQIKLTNITTDADPLRARGLVVTAERYLLLFGEGGIPRRLRWSASEDYTVFTSTTASPSEAGSLDVTTKGFLMAAKKVRSGVLIFSSVDVSLLSYLGPPYIYGIESLAEACGPVSSACIQQIAERTVWLATDGFWQYDGNVSPLPCPILESFLLQIDMQKGTLVSAGSIREYGEVIWFFCSESNLTDRPDSYILWGTRNNTWSLGTLSRDMYLEEEAYVFPIAVGPAEDNQTYIWAHEIDRSLAYEPNALAYAETGAFEIAQGERQARVSRLWHDVARSGVAGSHPSFKFFRANSADSPETQEGPYTPNAQGWIDTRWQGRQLRLRVEAPINQDWTLGKQRIELQPGGTR